MNTLGGRDQLDTGVTGCINLLVQDAMNTLGMTKEEQMSMFRTVAGILHFGNIEVKQRPREEWATIPTTTGQ